jgi:hypothetical protein
MADHFESELMCHLLRGLQISATGRAGENESLTGGSTNVNSSSHHELHQLV